MTPSETQEALDAFADIMVEGAEREWSKSVLVPPTVLCK